MIALPTFVILPKLCFLSYLKNWKTVIRCLIILLVYSTADSRNYPLHCTADKQWCLFTRIHNWIRIKIVLKSCNWIRIKILGICNTGLLIPFAAVMYKFKDHYLLTLSKYTNTKFNKLAYLISVPVFEWWIGESSELWNWSLVQSSSLQVLKRSFLLPTSSESSPMQA